MGATAAWAAEPFSKKHPKCVAVTALADWPDSCLVAMAKYTCETRSALDERYKCDCYGKANLKHLKDARKTATSWVNIQMIDPEECIDWPAVKADALKKCNGYFEGTASVPARHMGQETFCKCVETEAGNGTVYPLQACETMADKAYKEVKEKERQEILQRNEEQRRAAQQEREERRRQAKERRQKESAP